MHPAPTSANSAALLLLRIAFVLTATLGTLFIITQAGQALPYGRPLLLAVALLGGAALVRLFARLFRIVAAPLPAAPLPKRPLQH